MEYADIHCHLESSRYKTDLDEVISRAKSIGVKTIITSGVNPSTNLEALKLQKKYPEIVKVSFGVYPIDAIMETIGNAGEESQLRYVETFNVDEQLKWIEENSNQCVAIGEVGLDYQVVKGHNEEQKEVFQKVIDLSKKIDKPLIIHSRKAEEDAIDMMEKSNCKKVLMHCFNGKKSLIKKCVELGWSFSIPANITRLEHFKMMAKIIPLKQLMTETDGPYLAPVAGERSESSDVANTIKIIAKIKELPETEVANQILENAKKMFNL